MNTVISDAYCTMFIIGVVFIVSCVIVGFIYLKEQ